MPYTIFNFKSKKALKEAHARGLSIPVYQPGPFGPDVSDGPAILEGPHYPEPHKWYARVEVEAGQIKKGSKIK